MIANLRFALLRWVAKIAPRWLPQFQSLDSFVVLWVMARPSDRYALVSQAFTPLIRSDGTIVASSITEAFRIYGGIVKGFRVVAASWQPSDRTELLEALVRNFADEVKPNPDIDDAGKAVIAIGSLANVIPGDLQGTLEALHAFRTGR